MQDVDLYVQHKTQPAFRVKKENIFRNSKY